MNTTTVYQWAQAYAQHGLVCVPIPAGQKSPTHKGWQLRENCIVPPYWTGNIGLAHAYSNTCAIDIDDYDTAYRYCRELGVDLVDLAADAVRIDSGRPNRLKLIYRLPDWTGPLQRRQVAQDKHAIIDFRCASKKGHTVQDVLPPSIHPDTGRPYTWVGDFSHIPQIPQGLLDIWLQLLKQSAPTPRERNQGVNPELRDALFAIDPDLPRDEWVRIGMALHSADPDAIDLFDEWSAQGTKYIGDDIDPVWDSFSDDNQGVTVATLFGKAREAGWRGYKPLLTEIFEASLLRPLENPTSPEIVPGMAVLAPSLMMQLVHEIQALPPYQLGDLVGKAAIDSILLRAGDLSKPDQDDIGGLIKAHTGWSKRVVKDAIAELRQRNKAMLPERDETRKVLDEHLYAGALHCFVHKQSSAMYRPEAFYSMFEAVAPDLRDIALGRDGVLRVTSLDFDPSQPQVFERDGTTLYNVWTGLNVRATAGDVSVWLRHVEMLVPDPRERDHLLDWMAFTLQRPAEKINHGVVLNGLPGIGKDTLLAPLVHALGKYAKNVQAAGLLEQFNPWLLNAKLLVIQEPNYGRGRDAEKVHNKLLNMLAAPPETLSCNQKGIAQVDIRNIIAVVLLSNAKNPVRIPIGDRRYFVITSPLHLQEPEQWEPYFEGMWAWMLDGGFEFIAHFLMTRNVSRFKAKGHAPMTAAKHRIMMSTMPLLDRLLIEMEANRTGLYANGKPTAEELFTWLRREEGLTQMRLVGLDKSPSVPQLEEALRRLH